MSLILINVRGDLFAAEKTIPLDHGCKKANTRDRSKEDARHHFKIKPFSLLHSKKLIILT